MRSFVFALLCSAAVTSTACGGGDACTPAVLLDGGRLPEAQGWASHGTVTGVPASTDGTHLTVDTAAMTSGPTTGPYQVYSLDVGLVSGTAMNL